MPMSEWVCLPFLGSRDYLHGTTLLDHLRLFSPTDAEICFRIPHVMHGNCVRVWDGKDKQVPSTAAARLNWSRPEGDKGTLLVEVDAERHGLIRLPYDEAAVIAAAIYDGRTLRHDGPPPFSVVATAVPLFKAILETEGLTPQTGGQWMFTRLDACMIDRPFTSLALTLTVARLGQMAKSFVCLDGEPFGDMYFSWTSTFSESPALPSHHSGF